MRSIVTVPAPSLRELSHPVLTNEILTVDIQHLIDELVEVMEKQGNGAGIAAPQIGVQKRIIIIDHVEGPVAYINPKIISASEQMQESEEGCFSVPDVYGIVDRHKKIKVKAHTRHGEKILLKVTGFDAIVFQHEIDHLDGVLFIDRAKRFTKSSSHNLLA